MWRAQIKFQNISKIGFFKICPSQTKRRVFYIKTAVLRSIKVIQKHVYRFVADILLAGPGISRLNEGPAQELQ